MKFTRHVGPAYRLGKSLVKFKTLAENHLYWGFYLKNKWYRKLLYRLETSYYFGSKEKICLIQHPVRSAVFGWIWTKAIGFVIGLLFLIPIPLILTHLNYKGAYHSFFLGLFLMPHIDLFQKYAQFQKAITVIRCLSITFLLTHAFSQGVIEYNPDARMREIPLKVIKNDAS